MGNIICTVVEELWFPFHLSHLSSSLRLSSLPLCRLCLCHSWALELDHIISHCCFIELLPVDTVQAVLQAVSAGRVPVSIGSYMVGKMSEAQCKHVDSQTWVALMEHFCQYGKANMVVKIRQICKELELTVPDMVRELVLLFPSRSLHAHTRNVSLINVIIVCISGIVGGVELLCPSAQCVSGNRGVLSAEGAESIFLQCTLCLLHCEDPQRDERLQFSLSATEEAVGTQNDCKL